MRRRWIVLPLLGVAGYFAFFGGEYSWWDLRRLERERKAQEQAVQATRGEVRLLRARADSLEHDSLTVERLAREQYGLIRPGERLYRFADGATSAATAPPRAPGRSGPDSSSAGKVRQGAPAPAGHRVPGTPVR